MLAACLAGMRQDQGFQISGALGHGVKGRPGGEEEEGRSLNTRKVGRSQSVAADNPTKNYRRSPSLPDRLDVCAL